MLMTPGQRIRDYEIIKKLGEGGMGEVWLAKELFLDRFVAIKILNPELTRDNHFVERFTNEARIQAQLVHANIVQLITYFSEYNSHFMVMEYAPGITLKDLIRQTGPIPEDRAFNILRQIASALDYAHGKNIIHRDIKPSNIMIDPENNDSVKIMDFGIARLMTDAHLTRTGTKMGTLFYMSPEQVLAQKDIDYRTDIYSLGVVFFEMLSGRIPFDDNTDSDFLIQKQIIESELPDPREYYPSISISNVNLVAEMTEKDREDRIELEQIISGTKTYETAYPDEKKRGSGSSIDHDGQQDIIPEDAEEDHDSIMVMLYKKLSLNLKITTAVLILLPMLRGMVPDRFYDFYIYYILAFTATMYYAAHKMITQRKFRFSWMFLIMHILLINHSISLFAVWVENEMEFYPAFIFLIIQIVSLSIAYSTFKSKLVPGETELEKLNHKRGIKNFRTLLVWMVILSILLILAAYGTLN